MHLRSFTRQYQLHLLPASHSQILLGNLVWKPFWGVPKMSHSGMPNHISNALLDAEIIDTAEWHRLLNALKPKECPNAQLAWIKIEKANSISLSVLDRIGLGHEKEYLLESKVNNLCVKVLRNKLRTELDHYLEQLSHSKLRKVFRNPKKVYLITELYYGNITLTLEKKHQSQFEQQLNSIHWPVETHVDSQGTHQYEFHHNEVPFAYKMERLWRYNG